MDEELYNRVRWLEHKVSRPVERGIGINDEEFYRRLAWLEHKVVELLWFIIYSAGAIAGFEAVRNLLDADATWWVRSVVFGVTWVIVLEIGRRLLFKNIPKHMRHRA
jgi:hypothetical protein